LAATHFCRCAQVSITPHVSAVSFPEDVGAIFAENLARFLDSTSGEQAAPTDLRAELKHVVAWEKGY
jgi:phosphoglycerate dehydrogenase-like enzyme